MVNEKRPKTGFFGNCGGDPDHYLPTIILKHSPFQYGHFELSYIFQIQRNQKLCPDKLFVTFKFSKTQTGGLGITFFTFALKRTKFIVKCCLKIAESVSNIISIEKNEIY